MEYLIYGFQTDIRRYEMRDIFGWLLVIALVHFLAGNFIAGRRVHREYTRLIRQECFSSWWHRLSIRVLCLCLVLTAVVFIVSLLFQTTIQGPDFGEALGDVPLQAFFLFLLNFCFLTTFQQLIINLEQGEKLSFLLLVAVEVVSLYGGLICEEGACWIPGSWKMYCRSSRSLQAGYHVAVTSVIQILWIAACCLIGYKLLDRRR